MDNDSTKTKIATATIAAATEKAFEFLDAILTSPIKELSGILADKVKFWRFKNQVDTIIKAREFLTSKGITPRKIPIKDLSNLLELASFEEDEVMQTKWASLLANAADPNNKYDSCLVFSQILNQLTAKEVALLDFLFSICFLKSDRDRTYIERKEIISMRFADYSSTLLIFDNLLRLRLTEEEPPKISSNNTNQPILINSTQIRLSEFGAEFVRQSRFIP